MFNLITQAEQTRMLELILKLKDLKVVHNRKEAFKGAGIVEQWTRGEMSNFEYLMILNTTAGRTFNDLNQYFVFPWVLRDYKSAHLELGSEKAFRPLHLPLGAIDGELSQQIQRYAWVANLLVGSRARGRRRSTRTSCTARTTRTPPWSRTTWSGWSPSRTSTTSCRT